MYHLRHCSLVSRSRATTVPNFTYSRTRFVYISIEYLKLRQLGYRTYLIFLKLSLSTDEMDIRENILF